MIFICKESLRGRQPSGALRTMDINRGSTVSLEVSSYCSDLWAPAKVGRLSVTRCECRGRIVRKVKCIEAHKRYISIIVFVNYILYLFLSAQLLIYANLSLSISIYLSIYLCLYKYIYIYIYIYIYMYIYIGYRICAI